jgi:hypothetical protein
MERRQPEAVAVSDVCINLVVCLSTTQLRYFSDVRRVLVHGAGDVQSHTVCL